MGFNPLKLVEHAASSTAHAIGDAAKSGEEAFQGALKGAAETVERMSPSELGHTALDVASFVPGLGTATGLINAGWYAAEGDWGNAAFSAATAIPIAGDFVDAAKVGKDAVTIGKDVETAVKLGEDASKATEEGAKLAKDGKSLAQTADKGAESANKAVKDGKEAEEAGKAPVADTRAPSAPEARQVEPASSRLAPGGGLAAHEAAGGHLLEKHVGKTETELMDRLAREPRISGSSSFYDRTAAEAAVSDALDANAGNISSWLSGSSGRLRIDHTGSNPVGISVTRGVTGAADVSSTRLILVRDPSRLDGYRILTGFPTKP